MARKTLIALIVLYFCLFPFGQLGRIEVFNGITLHLTDIVAALFSGAGLLFLNLKIPKLSRPLLIFLGVALISLLLQTKNVTNTEWLVGLLYLLRFAVYLSFFVVCFSILKSKIIGKAFFTRLIKASGAYLIIFGLIQYFVFPDLRVLKNLNWDDHYFRAGGTFLDPGFLGILATLYFLFLLSFVWFSKNYSKQVYILLFLSLLCVVATFSRASILALIAGVTIYNLGKLRLLLSAKLLVVGVLIFLLLPKPGGEGVDLQRTSTIQFRLKNYQEGLEAGLKNPILGQGFNLYNIGRGKDVISHSRGGNDSSVIFIFTTTGLMGLAAFTYCLWSMLKASWRFRKTQYGLLVLSTTLALGVHSLFQNSLFYPWVLGWLFAVVALFEAEEVRD